MNTTNPTKATLIAFCMSGVFALAQFAEGASFDCGKAGTKVEHIICDSPEISRLDDELAQRYKAALQDQSKAGQIKREQKQWMKERNICNDAECVRAAYQNRIGQLLPPQYIPARTTQSNEPAETACLEPKIDWRNYEWTLITGKGEAICEEMLAYLKSRPSDIAPPTCPEERLPNNGNWTRPEIWDVSEEEKQAILKEIPDRWRNKPVGVSYERRIRNSKRLRVIRGDITRDGITESMLATNSDPDMRKTCEQSKRCARQEPLYKGAVMLVGGDSYDLLPMNEAGTLVNWSHPAMGLVPLLMGGELIYHKGLPYWMTTVFWNQDSHDHFELTRLRPNDPYSAIFRLEMVTYGSKSHPAKFADVISVSPKLDNPDDTHVCRFGYFHRDNLKQNPAKKVK
jgi:uncharacterized protein YecT (DUF1311 family)